jgi:hypothetical protein
MNPPQAHMPFAADFFERGFCGRRFAPPLVDFPS